MRYTLFVICLAMVNVVGCTSYREPQPPTMTELNAKLKSADPQEQIEAAAWVEQLGNRASETAPALRTALKSSDARVRRSAAAALARIGPAAQEAIPELILALRDPDSRVQKAAADALGELGPAASSSIAELEQLSQNGDACNSAQAALKKIRR